MTHRRLAMVLATALCVTACASSSTPEPVFKTVLVDDGGTVRTTTTPASNHVFDAPLARVWDAVAAAYADVGIPVDLSDPAGHRVGASSFYRSRHMNGQPVSHFANCGSGMTGLLADTRRVYFSAIATLTAIDATHTRVAIDVKPSAVDVSGNSTDRVTCGSTGALESLVFDAAMQRLAAK
ncbi:MAG TPA: hypothetical protein VMV51_13975 [Gemmatimonadaceae bacterium]|nr:hypothetical protein [Gemmatimonadaceae bacterium]